MKKSNWKSAKGDISLHVPSGIYYVRKKFLRQGLPMLFKSTGETKQHLAKNKAIDLIKAHLDRHLKRTKSFTEVVDEFLRVETPNFSKRRLSTQINHARYFAELKRELGDHPITQVVDEAFWSDWFRIFQTKKRRTTFNDYVVYMNMLIRFAYRRKYIDRLAKLDFVDAVKVSGRVLTKEERERIYNAMGVDGKDQFKLAYECALRLREMLYLSWDRIDLETGKVIFRQDDVKTGRKTGRGREIIVSPGALERLRARFVRQAGASPFVFPSKGNPNKPQHQNKAMWTRAKKKAGILGRCRWHDIRHTAITNMLLDAREDIISVSEYVGTSVRILQKVYLHSTAEKTRSVASALSVGS